MKKCLAMAVVVTMFVVAPAAAPQAQSQSSPELFDHFAPVVVTPCGNLEMSLTLNDTEPGRHMSRFTMRVKGKAVLHQVLEGTGEQQKKTYWTHSNNQWVMVPVAKDDLYLTNHIVADVLRKHDMSIDSHHFKRCHESFLESLRQAHEHEQERTRSGK